MAKPNARFMMLGKSKFVHVVHTKAYDLKHSGCQFVRKMQVADKVGKGKGLSPDAVEALEPCPHCEPLAVINEQYPERAKEKKAAKKTDFKDAMREENRPKTGKGSKPKKVRATKEARPKAARKGKAAGSRSSGDSTQSKADALVAFAKEAGWDAHAVTVKDEPGVLVEASRDPEFITCWFVDGKYDTVRHAVLKVGDWSGKLRGVHGCRKQMANEGRDRPYPDPGKGRTAKRATKKGKHDEQQEDIVPEDESPEDARRRVPFLIDDDATAIIEAVKGKTIRWRNGLSGTMDEAMVPSKVKGKKRDIVTISEHPKTGKRILDFLEVVGIDDGHEVYGPERAVALDKIVRLVG